MRPSSLWLALALSACSSGPIAWSDSVRTMTDFGFPQRPAPSCGERTQVITNGVLLASAWWSPRLDGGANLMVATQASGTVARAVDTTDAGTNACNKPRPDVAVDGENVYVVYSMRAKEGPGIFLSHSMDGGRTFHSPVAVVYGARLGAASVSASGNFVVVAFEDPNATPTSVSVAVSNTMGHLFEFREVLSPKGVAAEDPFTRVMAGKVAVSWRRAGDTVRIGVEGTIR